jgi:4-aminobutyrate aminotransferase-like enzyme/Ser/Thr protein kinase RdoA (MazF antagonist)
VYSCGEQDIRYRYTPFPGRVKIVAMTLTVEARPVFSAEAVGELVREHYGIDGALEPLPSEWDQNFDLDAGEAGRFVVKIANRGHPTEVLDFQNAAMTRLTAEWSAAASPRVVESRSRSQIVEVPGSDGVTFRMRVLTYLPGEPMVAVRPVDAKSLERLGFALGGLDLCLAGFAHPAMDRELPWDLRGAEWISTETRRISDPKRRGLVERLLLQYRGRIKPLLRDLPMSVIHNDANDENILLAPHAEGGWAIAGLLDFGDMLRSHTINELAIAGAYAMFGGDSPLETLAAMAAGYHRAQPLLEDEIHVLFPLACLRLCVSVTTSAIAAEEDPDNPHRQISDADAWRMLEHLDDIDWRDAEDGLRKACGIGKRSHVQPGDHGQSYDQVLGERRRRLGYSLRLAYDEPVEIVRGRGQFLFEPNGRAYLDCVNNVCHVGHCHPKVVAALSKQAAVLNTNTRYLHPSIVEYAGRLTATLPDPLSVCFLVNSGSEANELAVRLARTHTGRQDVIVLEGGYHGNTSTLVDLSPYKCEGPGGQGLAEWAHKVVKPDPYRGPHRGMGTDTGRAYAEYVREACERLTVANRPPALFLCEPLLGCGGQIVPPEGYLRDSFEHVRSAGGVCVADEVQVGMGRVGTHYWAFEAQDVVPDIVTVGKPIGNGHPLGAVITTPEIARSFDNGMEFFNTFGGNPVSVAVGMAVMDVIEEEGLRQRAERVGRYLAEGFRDLGTRRPEIGDVRGLGMFMGVELVRDRETLEPATEETSRLIERLRSEGILLSAEGPHENVLKIKPPLPFGETDADLLLSAVDRALGEIGLH